MGAVAGAVFALGAQALTRKVLRALKARALNKASILAERRQHFCPAQSISYANVDPLLIVGGERATLVDESGRVFLDTRNNVAHVGHAHPAVAKAVAEQAAAQGLKHWAPSADGTSVVPYAVEHEDEFGRPYPPGEEWRKYVHTPLVPPRERARLAERRRHRD